MNTACAVAALLVEPYVLMLLWGWFVVPLGARPLTYWLAMGLGLVIALTTHANGIKRETAQAGYEHASIVVVVWLLGWAVHFAVRQ